MVPSKLWMNSILKEYAVQKYGYWRKVVIKHPISKHQPTNFELSREKRGDNVCLANVCLCTLYLTETANGQKVCQSFESGNNFRDMQELTIAFRKWMEQVEILNPFCMQTAFTISTNWNKNGAHGCAVLWFKLFYFYVNRHCPQLKKRYDQVWVILQIFFITPIVFLAFPPDKKQFVGRTSEIWPSRTKMVKSAQTISTC